jgi:hypothetical protein
MDILKQYLFRNNGERNIRNWARRLHVFRFVRAYGGMNNEGDSLVAMFKYRNTNELLEFFKFAGIKPVQHTTMPPQPVLGRPYSPDEMSKFPSLISGTEWIEQPGHCQIAGQMVFVFCENGRIKVAVSDGYDVTEAAVVRAEIIEKLLKDAPLPRIEPPVDDKHCVCPKYYPEYFS